MIKVYKILKKTNVEGPGVRFCIWTQGCSRHCRGCFARDTWDFDKGVDYNIKDLFALIKTQKEIEGVTFLGGEPFEQAKALSKLAKLIKDTGLSVVCFTGYTFEELQTKNDEYTQQLLSNIDLLIDGSFEQENFDLSRPWVGSKNQRYIFLSDFYSENDIKKYKIK